MDKSWMSLRFVSRLLIVAVYIALGVLVYWHVGYTEEVEDTLPNYQHKSNHIGVAAPDYQLDDGRLPDDRTPAEWVNRKKVVIFAATKFFNMDITTERFLAECHSTKDYCRISEDPKDLEVADAILFHNADYQESKVPKPRVKNRPHILWSLESPAHDMFRPGKDIINWTMTYRLDADVWYPYGHFVQRPKKVAVDYEAIWKMKDNSKTATWLASNCFTVNKRFDLIKYLIDKGLPIDAWGRCGKNPPKCEGVERQGYPCVVDLIKPYKFYMSIENSNCNDYITEKFYETLHSRMAVPIVLARSYYRRVGAPEGAFIAIDDFANLDEFIAYVKKVAADKQLYLKYHTWRESWEVKPEHDDTAGFCELCRKLQTTNRGHHSYYDIAWWHTFNQCNQSIAQRYLPGKP